MAGHAYHPKAAAEFNKDGARRAWHDKALWFVREKRDKAAALVPDWEPLRCAAEGIKQHTLSRLPEYLEEFEARAQENGAVVHWAADGAEFNQIVLGILNENNAQRVVKSKSMLTEECGLNPLLEGRGIEVTDTDLGERIIQYRHEPPSHIVLPAIHIKKEEIGTLFEAELGTENGNADPAYLTHAARLDLRSRMMAADAGITGVNFAVAETGGITVCTNEGNADLGTTLPKIHIACMGIEKLVPKFEDLAVFVRLLARSATGQAVTTYTTHFTKPAAGRQLHIVLVDNGRAKIRAEGRYRPALQCIRCGACLNTCPVYRRSGGYSYNHSIPGPIGSILAPHGDTAEKASLPFASSLCGSCTDVCPVKVNLHEQLLHWRERVVEDVGAPFSKRLMVKGMAFVFGSAGRLALAGRFGRMALRLPRVFLYHGLNVWGQHREMPVPPKASFRELYRKRKAK